MDTHALYELQCLTRYEHIGIQTVPPPLSIPKWRTFSVLLRKIMTLSQSATRVTAQENADGGGLNKMELPDCLLDD